MAEDSKNVEIAGDNAVAKGFKYGCGGAVGVVFALTVLPFLVLGGCLVVGVAASSPGKSEAGELRRDTKIMSVPKGEDVNVVDAHMFALREDVFAKSPTGEHTVMAGLVRVKVLGNGRDGCRRVQLPEGTTYWVDGETLCSKSPK